MLEDFSLYFLTITNVEGTLYPQFDIRMIMMASHQSSEKGVQKDMFFASLKFVLIKSVWFVFLK